MGIDRLVQECRHAALAVGLFVAFTIPPGLGAQGSGTVTGVITTKARELQPLRVTMDQQVCGTALPDETVVVDGNARLANAVVVLVGARSRSGATSGGVMNEKCRFAPRVQVAKPKATITTSSRDPILHTTNASMDGGKGLFNVAVPLPGTTIAKSVAGPGLVRLVCNTHPWMRGYIIVTDDIAAVTRVDGEFTLTDVPAGTYELRVWHEMLKAQSQKVVVEGQKTVKVNLELR